MSDSLAQQLEESQAAYQQLYAQYQSELAAIATWQQRIKAEKAECERKIAAIWAAVLNADESDYHQNARIHQILEGN